MRANVSALLTVLALLPANAALADVVISNKPTSNMSCDAGVCTATAKKAVLNVGDLRTMLGSGDVTVKTGTVAKDIAIAQPLTWTSTSRLTLDAQQSVIVNKQVTVMGQGWLTVTTNDAGNNGRSAKGKKNDGEFVIVPERGSVQLWDSTSSLIIDGQSYTLVYDIKTLAADTAANPSGFYALAKAYDASVDGTYSTPPIVGVSGIVEGLGNEILSLAIHTTGGISASFIKAVLSNGAIRHLGILNATISSAPSSGQAVMARNNLGRIISCWVSGKMTFSSAADAGGLVSENDGLIARSHANVRLIGFHSKDVGGLVGFQSDTGEIVSSYALHSVALRFSDSANVGGLVGTSAGVIRDSFARNRVVAGRDDDGSAYGGLVGENEAGAQITTSYAAGPMTFKTAVQAGGLIGFDGSAAGNMKDSYWDLDMGISDPSRGAGNIPNDPGITGLTDAQLKAGLPAGFDPEIWGSDPNINNGYPYLCANAPQ